MCAVKHSSLKNSFSDGDGTKAMIQISLNTNTNTLTNQRKLVQGAQNLGVATTLVGSENESSVPSANRPNFQLPSIAVMLVDAYHDVYEIGLNIS